MHIDDDAEFDGDAQRAIGAGEAAIAAAYAAASGDASWSEALSCVERALGLRAAWVVDVDLQAGTLIDGRFSRPAVRTVQEAYALGHRSASPLIGPLDGLEPLVWLRDDEAFNVEFLDAHPFYRHVVAPLGGSRVSAIKLCDGTSRTTVLLALHEGAPPPSGRDGGDDPGAHRIALHLQRALVLEARMRRRAGPCGDWAGLLEQFSRPMMLVGADRALHYANRAACALIEDGSMLGVTRGRLRITSKTAERRLADAIARLEQSAAPRRPDRPTPWVHGRLLIGADGTDVRLYLKRLPGAADGSADASGPIWLLLHDVSADGPNSAGALAETFGFTHAEARVCVGLVRGQLLPDIAAEHGISLNTVRTQVRSAMRRVGVGRQIDLVRMLLTMPDVVA